MQAYIICHFSPSIGKLDIEERVEGTVSQVGQADGQGRCGEILMGLKDVYISYMHVDYHLGLMNIMQLRERAFISQDREVKKLYIITSITNRLASFLKYYHVKFEQLILYNARDEDTMVENSAEKHQLLYPDTLQGVLTDIYLAKLFTIHMHSV